MDVQNRLNLSDWLPALDRVRSLDFVPTEDSAALVELSARLHLPIRLCYTGSKICSGTITTKKARVFADMPALKPLLRDNQPVSDLTMPPDLRTYTDRQPGAAILAPPPERSIRCSRSSKRE